MNIKVVFTEGHLEGISEMIIKSQNEKQEQFATMIGKSNENGDLEVEDFEIWDSKDLEQTQTTVTPISDKHWETIGFNMNAKNCDFIVTMHTHPEFYGTNPRGLDKYDVQTFKKWTKNFENFTGRICINGIVTERDGILLTYYNKDLDEFKKIEYEIIQSKKTRR